MSCCGSYNDCKGNNDDTYRSLLNYDIHVLILREHTVAVKFVFQFVHQDLDIWTSLSLV